MKLQYTFSRTFSFLPFLLAAFTWLATNNTYAGGVVSGDGNCDIVPWTANGGGPSCACTWYTQTAPGVYTLVCGWTNCGQEYLEDCIWDCNGDSNGALPMDPDSQFRDCSEVASGTPPGGTTIYCWYNGVGNGAGEVTCNNVAIVVLPVEMSYFNGFHDGSSNVLEWKTSSELRNDHFVIMHSFDGITFNNEAIIDGMGTTHEETSYRFQHINLEKRVNYYKIRQVDFNGEFDESDVIAIDNREVNSSELFIGPYPNPAKSYFNFNYNGRDYSNPISLSLIDQSGKRVIDNLLIQPGTSWQGIPIKIEEFDSGSYFLELIQNDIRETKMLNIIH